MDSIRLDDLDPISINMSEDAPSSSSYGPGIELLMNDRVKSGSSGSSYSNKPASMGDLDRMDEEFSRNEVMDMIYKDLILDGVKELNLKDVLINVFFVYGDK